MIRASLAGLLGAALGACTPIFPEPDAGPMFQRLSFFGAKPPLGLLQSERQPLVPDGGCRLNVTNVQVTSTATDAGSTIFGQAFLNLANKDPPSTNNDSPLQYFSNVAFQPDSAFGPTNYHLQQPLIIGLDPLVSWLFPRNDSRTNYLTLEVTDGITTLQLVWSLDLSLCDPRPF
jgi:hypothetical protein